MHQMFTDTRQRGKPIGDLVTSHRRIAPFSQNRTMTACVQYIAFDAPLSTDRLRGKNAKTAIAKNDVLPFL